MAIFLYIVGVAYLMFNGEAIFGQVKSFLIPVAMLLLFVFSASITSLLFFGRPILLYLAGFKKEGVRLVFYTLGFLFAITACVFLVLLLFA